MVPFLEEITDEMMSNLFDAISTDKDLMMIYNSEINSHLHLPKITSEMSTLIDAISADEDAMMI